MISQRLHKLYTFIKYAKCIYFYNFLGIVMQSFMHLKSDNCDLQKDIIVFPFKLLYIYYKT